MGLDELLQIIAKPKSSFSIEFVCFFHNRNFLDFESIELGIV